MVLREVIENLKNTFFDHSDRKAFLKSAKLTSISPSFIDRTIFIAETNIFSTLLYSSFEKSFASFKK